MYKLIIIDDEEKIASGMAQLFPWQNIGFEVVQVFTSARKALQYIAENPVDVVLTDIEMPDMNGLELSHRLMEYPNIQKIFFQQLQQLRILPRGAAKRRGGLPDETGGLQRPAGML